MLSDSNRTVAIFTLIFLATNLLGLYTGLQYFSGVQTGQLAPVVENPQNVENSFIFFFQIMIGTVILILAIRFWGKSIKFFEAFAVFFASLIVFDSLFPVLIYSIPMSLVLAALLTAWKMLRPTLLSQNVAVIFSGAGIGGLMGASLGIFPIMVFMILLSIYDFIAVFITKHMVYIAKEVTKTPTAFTAAVPTNFKNIASFKGTPSKGGRKLGRVFQLGAGDIIIPLMFFVSVAANVNLASSVFVLVGSTLALIFLIGYVAKKAKRPLPALPVLVFGSFAGFLISLLIL